MRVDELARLMATARYHGHDRGWQALVEQEFMRCATLAMPPAPAVDEEGKPVEAKGGETQPGQESYGSASSGLPSLDNPALTGGQPGGQPSVGAPA
jgi:hypothetical protein